MCACQNAMFDEETSPHDQCDTGFARHKEVGCMRSWDAKPASGGGGDCTALTLQAAATTSACRKVCIELEEGMFLLLPAIVPTLSLTCHHSACD